MLPAGKLDDTLLQTFKQHYPSEYALWQKGQLEFPFYHELYWHEFTGILSIDAFRLYKRKGGILPQFLQRWNKRQVEDFNQIPVEAYLDLTVMQTAHNATEETERIYLLEVVATEEDRYAVYLQWGSPATHYVL